MSLLQVNPDNCRYKGLYSHNSKNKYNDFMEFIGQHEKKNIIKMYTSCHSVPVLTNRRPRRDNTLVNKLNCLTMIA